MTRLTIVADADALIAQNNSEDKHHQMAMTISRKLIEKDARVVYPLTAITEAATYMQRVLNSTASAYGTVTIMSGPEMEVAEINKQTLTHALKFFSPKTSKKNTIFDCIVAAVAEENEADAIFSFDKFYKKQGFRLVSELV